MISARAFKSTVAVVALGDCSGGSPAVGGFSVDEALRFAQQCAQRFLDTGGVQRPHWQARAEAVHRTFVERRLSPGGAADVLAMSVLADDLEPAEGR